MIIEEGVQAPRIGKGGVKEKRARPETVESGFRYNGLHMNSWPDAAMPRFRNEKNSNRKGAYRLPAMVRWPGKIKAGMVSNDMQSAPFPANVGDFNAEGNPDILWRNISTGRTTVWYMDGATWNGNWGDVLPIVSDPNWSIVGR